MITKTLSPLLVTSSRFVRKDWDCWHFLYKNFNYFYTDMDPFFSMIDLAQAVFLFFPFPVTSNMIKFDWEFSLWASFLLKVHYLMTLNIIIFTYYSLLLILKLYSIFQYGFDACFISYLRTYRRMESCYSIVSAHFWVIFQIQVWSIALVSRLLSDLKQPLNSMIDFKRSMKVRFLWLQYLWISLPNFGLVLCMPVLMN